jgi:uncharacterized membrane protein YcaP (DUF421 family)
MKKEEIHLEDIQRILFGQTPPIFLLEVFIRTLIVYLILLFVVNKLGKRMSGQLTIMELAVMLTLGAIVSVPMQTPDRGILQGVLLLMCAVGFQRGITLLGYKNGRFEDITQGKTSLLVKDGVMQLEQMKLDRISRQQLFAELRGQDIYNLGGVERVYFEACGLFSVFQSEEPRPGLPLYPPDDQNVLQVTHAAVTEHHTGLKACQHCGFVKEEGQLNECPVCNRQEWTTAIN